MIIKAKTKVKDAIKEHPELKDLLISMSPKFKKLTNPLIFNTMGRWATFADVAKIGNLSICELLHKVNKAVGNEDNLYKSFPECIKEEKEEFKFNRPDWLMSVSNIITFDVRDYDGFFLPDILDKLQSLKSNQALKVINSFDPVPLKRMLDEEEREYFLQKINEDEYHIFINYKKPDIKITNENWKEYIDTFEELNVVGMKEDPFELIIKKAQSIPEGGGFVLIQVFEPIPLINMLTQMGFEYLSKQVSDFRWRIYFYKKIRDKAGAIRKYQKVPVVLQSATPVTYPIIMRMLKSEELMDRIEIKELKVWYETEKHMAWIVNQKADITFSAVAAAAKLFLTNVDIKMMSVDIWNNFHLLTRGYRAKTFADLKGHKIYMPLFKEAPPKVMTNFLMKNSGFNPDEFDFKFGEPFGRPEEIVASLLSKEADTALLREPEASFAIAKGHGEIFEDISYSEIWKKVQNTKIDLPNAGLIFKGEFLRKNREVADLFVKVLSESIDWVKTHIKESAMQSYDIMGHTVEETELFLQRVNFKHIPAVQILEDIIKYIQVLNGKERYTFENLKDMFLY